MTALLSFVIIIIIIIIICQMDHVTLRPLTVILDVMALVGDTGLMLHMYTKFEVIVQFGRYDAIQLSALVGLVYKPTTENLGLSAFLRCVKRLTHVIAIGWKSVCPSIRPSHVVNQNGSTYRQTVLTAW